MQPPDVFIPFPTEHGTISLDPTFNLRVNDSHMSVKLKSRFMNETEDDNSPKYRNLGSVKMVPATWEDYSNQKEGNHFNTFMNKLSKSAKTLTQSGDSFKPITMQNEEAQKNFTSLWVSGREDPEYTKIEKIWGSKLRDKAKGKTKKAQKRLQLEKGLLYYNDGGVKKDRTAKRLYLIPGIRDNPMLTDQV